MAVPTPTSTNPNPAIQFAILIAVICALLNVAFFFLSGVYVSDKTIDAPINEAVLHNVRIAFVVFSGTVSLGSIGAAFATKWVAHGLSTIAGLASLVAAYYAFKTTMPLVLPVSLAVVGMLFPLLAWRSWANSRAAWSCMVAMCFTLALVLLFGAPKVRSQVGIGIWIAFIIPGMLTVAGVALTMLRGNYREQG